MVSKEGESSKPTRQGADRDLVQMEQARRNQCGIRVNILRCIVNLDSQVFPQGIIHLTNICLVRFGVYYHNSFIFTHNITFENAHGLRIVYKCTQVLMLMFVV